MLVGLVAYVERPCEEFPIVDMHIDPSGLWPQVPVLGVFSAHSIPFQCAIGVVRDECVAGGA